VLCYLIDDKERILMLHRIKKKNDMHKNKWIGIGGKIEKGESPEDAIIREVKEETNLKIIVPKFVGMLFEPSFFDKEDWYVFIYTSHIFSGHISNCDEGILKWVNYNDLKNLDMWEGDRLFLNWIKNGKFFSAKFNYKNNCLIEKDVIFY
jgi:8-oxo-dGTP diphosphatase